MDGNNILNFSKNRYITLTNPFHNWLSRSPIEKGLTTLVIIMVCFSSSDLFVGTLSSCKDMNEGELGRYSALH